MSSKLLGIGSFVCTLFTFVNQSLLDYDGNGELLYFLVLTFNGMILFTEATIRGRIF